MFNILFYKTSAVLILRVTAKSPFQINITTWNITLSLSQSYTRDTSHMSLYKLFHYDMSLFQRVISPSVPSTFNSYDHLGRPYFLHALPSPNGIRTIISVSLQSFQTQFPHFQTCRKSSQITFQATQQTIVNVCRERKVGTAKCKHAQSHIGVARC